MGDSKESFTKAELNENYGQSTKAPELLGNLMCSKEGLDDFRAATSKAEPVCKYLPDSTDLLYQFDGSPKNEPSEKSAAQLSSSAPTDKQVYQFDGSPIDQGYYKFDGSPIDQGYYKFDGSPYVDKSKDASAEKPANGDKNHIQKSGQLELTFDDKGNVSSLKDGHHTFRKFDGKWFEVLDGGKEQVPVKNVEYDKKDGSYSFTNETGKFAYDSKDRLVEAPMGEGHSRKFHYDANGQVNKIDGRLGHWERQVVNGHVSWKNANGQVWNGDFKVTENGLEFHGDHGVAWGFTTKGKDVRLNK